MEAMQRVTSGASEGPPIGGADIRLHDPVQHHIGSAPDILSPTGDLHEHSSNPPRVSPGHTLHDAHLRGPTLRDCIRSPCQANHENGIRNLSPPESWDGSFHRHLLYGFGCHHRAQEKELSRNALHFLDSSAVSHLWSVRDVHGGGTHRVLLQTVNTRDAVLPNGNDLLFVFLRLLSELALGVFSE